MLNLTHMHPLESYLNALSASRVGTVETSNYGALQNLLNHYGSKLEPEISCVVHPRSKGKGSGIPDGAFFEARTLKKAGELSSNADWLRTQAQTARAAIEVKGTKQDLTELVASEQVQKYLKDYGYVLATNLYQFALVEADSGRVVEQLQLAVSEQHFWDERVAHPRKAATELGQQLEDFLRRVMLYRIPLARPQDLAWFLASYAHDALRLMNEMGAKALGGIERAFADTLGMEFKDAKARRLFVSSTVQTLFYGIFAAWVRWHGRNRNDHSAAFQWRDTPEQLTLPVIASLFEQLTKKQLLDQQEGELRRILDRTQELLNRVKRGEFFKQFSEEHAVLYFYEPFLEAFDAELRKELGVWYTPPEIVKYMVERVDRVLRDELGREDGLADPSVIVLDPCCGTGSFILEAIRRIHQTLVERGADDLALAELRKAAQKRVFGFEILTAPFVIAHLQVGMLLDELGVPFSEQQRAGIYLTNALTGWEPPDEEKQLNLNLDPALEEEREAAEHVKREEKVLVIIGNPPYSGFSGIAQSPEERRLSERYRKAKRVAAPQGQGLNELYVRFFSMAERRITEPLAGSAAPAEGIVCFISNYSWLDGLSHTAMREHYLEAFDKIWIDCLNGDKYKTGKLTPDGDPDPSVFSTERNREGIQVGTAIATLLRLPKHDYGQSAEVSYRDWWGKEKLNNIERAGSERYLEETPWCAFEPSTSLGLSMRPGEVSQSYTSWPTMTDMFPLNVAGIKTSRDEFIIDIEIESLQNRLAEYLDDSIGVEEIRSKYPAAMKGADGFDASSTRKQLLQRGFRKEKLRPYYYRAFDTRWIYYETETELIDRSREGYEDQVFPGNLWIEVRQRDNTDKFSRGCVIGTLADNMGNGLSLFIPRHVAFKDELHSDKLQLRVNASAELLSYLERTTASEYEPFASCIALLHSPAFREEFDFPLRNGFPRVPLPNSPDLLTQSAALGQQVASLLDVLQAVPGVAGAQGAAASGKVRPELSRLARIDLGGLDLNSEAARRMTAGWGHRGQGGVVMPAKGRVTPYTLTQEEQALLEPHTALLGEKFLTIHVNDKVRWDCVPEKVWTYTLGGYQVVKKWLSYREYKVLGRALHEDELREVQNMIRRIAALLLLGPELDANYERVKADAYPWPRKGEA